MEASRILWLSSLRSRLDRSFPANLRRKSLSTLSSCLRCGAPPQPPAPPKLIPLRGCSGSRIFAAFAGSPGPAAFALQWPQAAALRASPWANAINQGATVWPWRHLTRWPLLLCCWRCLCWQVWQVCAGGCCAVTLAAAWFLFMGGVALAPGLLLGGVFSDGVGGAARLLLGGPSLDGPASSWGPLLLALCLGFVWLSEVEQARFDREAHLGEAACNGPVARLVDNESTGLGAPLAAEVGRFALEVSPEQRLTPNLPRTPASTGLHIVHGAGLCCNDAGVSARFLQQGACQPDGGHLVFCVFFGA